MFNPKTKREVIRHTVSDNVADYQYLVGSLHRDSDDFELYRTVSVVVETFDEVDGPIIVAYRRHISETGELMPMTEDD